MGQASKTTPSDLAACRQAMVASQVELRGIVTPSVLQAMREVRREAFLPRELAEFAYHDTALLVGPNQLMPQPYIVALMADALALTGTEKVLDVGAGSGYLAAVLGHLAQQVFSIERIPELCDKAREEMAAEGISNVHVLLGDASQGCPGEAPFDAIVVTAGGLKPPDALLHQLKIGGRMVIPLGSDARIQELVCITRESEGEYRYDDLADINFLPLKASFGWQAEELSASTPFGQWVMLDRETTLSQRIAAVAQGFDNEENLPLAGLLERIGDSRIVLLGEASHGTSEFYLIRERITRALIEQKGFSFIAIEGDWPDAARVDHYVRHAEYPASEWIAFARFPTWMWRNEEVRGFVDWLRAYNAPLPAERRVAFHGLDLYSLYNSIQAILRYLDDVDPKVAAIARERYGCLTPYQTDPGAYARAALNPDYESCEQPVLDMLRDLQAKHRLYAEHNGERFLNTVQNARLVANAEEYYRTMFYGSRSAWNMRDTHMFETLENLLDHHGENSRAVVWAHNSHIGDSEATDMALRGEFNIGRLCRARYGQQVYSIGFGTHSGTVAAASDWGRPMEIKQVRPALDGSIESLCHQSGVSRFMLPLRQGDAVLLNGLNTRHLERAIGVIYRPETERQSHYFETRLPGQFDEYVWLDQTRAVTPLATGSLRGMPDTYPFGV
ncbi:protein-L-isoaspartate(D-aspartate) O-methyltransferase [Marinobacter zhejiangensis]|uniref:Protein-L-isoaspartate O-methyltransferase n=1 Tax=Marinobacter zhejiangensis TaxID=488535 RepID=A0A1I4Q2X1_9GAMM|nr:protein-L-isoaspartate(D-aspartate) O-methyltransferase [Marinobacter zhejiangensis]SFM34377.1 protein-L-isoaspartate(D-aspartate) O-methyltransferase [Marinobacter zhejiangensis]